MVSTVKTELPFLLPVSSHMQVAISVLDMDAAASDSQHLELLHVDVIGRQNGHKNAVIGCQIMRYSKIMAQIVVVSTAITTVTWHFNQHVVHIYLAINETHVTPNSTNLHTA